MTNVDLENWTKEDVQKWADNLGINFDSEITGKQLFDMEEYDLPKKWSIGKRKKVMRAIRALQPKS